MLDIGANVARMQEDMNKVVRTVEDGMNQIQSIAAKAGVALSAAFLVREAIQFGEQVIKNADQLVKLSQSTGIAVESLSALKYAAGMANIDVESLAKGIERFSRNMLEAQAGTGTAKDALKALGISVQDSSGNLLNSDVALGKVADKFAEMKDGSAKTALAIQIFGRAGAELIPLLNQGSGSLAEMRAEAEKLGLIMSTETAQQMERINDNFKRMHAATQGIAIDIMTTLAPTLENLTNIWLEAGREMGAFSAIGTAVGYVLKTLASVGLGLGAVYRDLTMYLGAAGAAMVSIASGDFKTAAQIMQMEAKDVEAMWTQTGLRVEKIWDKSAEDALKSAHKMKTGLQEGPALPTADDKAIEKVLEKLQEEVEAIQMGSDALELYKKGLHEATAEQQAFGLYLIRTIEAYEQSKRALLDQYKAEEEDQKIIQENEKALLDLVGAVQKHAITASMDEEEIAKWDLTLKGASKTMMDNVETYFQAIRAAKDYQDQINLVKGVIEETQSPMDKYEDRLKEIQGLLDSGMISGQKALEAQGVAWEKMVGKAKDTTTEQERIQIEFGKKLAKIKLDDAEYAIMEINREATIFKNAGADEVAVAVWAAKEKQKVSREWQDGAVRGLQDYYVVASNAAKNTEEVFTHAFKHMEDNLVNFIKTGKLNFSKFIDDLITDILRLAVRQTITGPLAAGLSSTISDLFLGGTSAPGAATGAGATVQGGGAGYGGAGSSHEGSIIGASSLATRSYPAAMLLSAPRYHGGLQPDEFPTILQRGEGVFTPEQMKAMGSQTNMSINIPVNMAGGDPRKASQMSRDLENELEPAVRKIIGRYM